MNSVILTTVTRLMAPILFAFAVFILWRGHNDPGGGFIGGLIAVTALALVEKSRGLAYAEKTLRIEPLHIAALGLACAVTSALWGAIAKGAVLAGVWPFKTVELYLLKPLGSILLFDTGVFLVVVGGVSAMLFALEEAALEVQPPEEDDADADDIGRGGGGGGGSGAPGGEQH
ncbi:MAG: MnhB domain-containing protein [Pseudomonadota bacterium]